MSNKPSKKLPINTQQIDYEINILINNKEPNCSQCLGVVTELDEDEIDTLKKMNLFNIEYYADKVKSTSSKSRTYKKSRIIHTIETKLMNSIHQNLCPKEEWLQRNLIRTIPTSAFTIFINNTNSSSTYDPLCIATISKFTSTDDFDDNIKDIIHSNDSKFLYIDVFCGSSEYTKCAYHLMNIIKMIAYHLEYEYIVLTSISNKHTLKWYKSQKFLMKKNFYNNIFYYQVTSKDEHYKRSEIQGTCKIIDSSPKAECISSSSYSDSSQKSNKKTKKLYRKSSK